MEQFLPKSFIQVIAAILTSFALLFSIISVWNNIRSHGSRLFAIFLVAALAAFADHWATYFASLFIIATAVTELEFLQNLAAIIRGNQAYFRYKKDFIPKKEVEESINKELQTSIDDLERDQSLKSTVSFPLDEGKLNSMPQYIIAEELVFRYLEQKYKQTISRHVRYHGGGGTLLEFDGVMEDSNKDILLEILIPLSPALLERRFKEKMAILMGAAGYQAMKRKRTELKIIVVTHEELTDKITKLHGIASEMISIGKLQIEFSVENLTYSEIGFNK